MKTVVPGGQPDPTTVTEVPPRPDVGDRMSTGWIVDGALVVGVADGLLLGEDEVVVAEAVVLKDGAVDGDALWRLGVGLMVTPLVGVGKMFDGVPPKPKVSGDPCPGLLMTAIAMPSASAMITAMTPMTGDTVGPGS
jgi:hypothetical protein